MVGTSQEVGDSSGGSNTLRNLSSLWLLSLQGMRTQKRRELGRPFDAQDLAILLFQG